MLDSIWKSRSFNEIVKEVIVVDNHSTDDTPDAVLALSKDIIVKVMPKNILSAGARQQGLDIATGDYVMFIDDDNVIESDCIFKLKEALDMDANLGMVGPLMLLYDKPNTIWCAGGYIDKLGIPRHLSQNQERATLKKGTILTMVDYFPNAWMIRAELRVKGVKYDYSLFPHNWSEQDFGRQIQTLGYKIGTVVDAATLHDVGYSHRTTRLSTHTLGDQARSRILFRRKYLNNLPQWLFFWCVLFPASSAYYALLLFSKGFKSGLSGLMIYLNGTIRGLFIDLPKDNADFFDSMVLENSLVIGYYGGTNFGDELLLETIFNIFKKKGVHKAAFYYSDPKVYSTYHKDFGYKMVPPNLSHVLAAFLTCDRIIIGGGGLWGLDMNYRIALLSILLFVGRYVFRKEIYLIGVGYYSSVPAWGRPFAALAAISANKIYARDPESLAGFLRLNNNSYLQPDIAFRLPDLNLSSYDQEASANELATLITDNPKVTILAARHFSLRHNKEKRINNYSKVLEQYIARCNRDVVLMLLTSEESDADNFKFFKELQRKYPNVIGIVKANFNPILMYTILKTARSGIKVVAPQYHMQLIAHLARVSFVPIAYDNKNKELFNFLGYTKYVDISNITAEDLLSSNDELS